MIYARPFDWQAANPIEVVALLDGFVAFPEFLAYPHSPEQARVLGAALLTDPKHLVFEARAGTDITGILMLTRVVPRVDALFHFMFIDRDLASKRKLLKNFLGYCFTDLGFHRLSMEVPDVKIDLEAGGRDRGTRLERFARRTLGFRLEGEIRDRNPELPKCVTNDFIARQGSRSEQTYFDGQKWSDIVRLRLLASEWVGEPGG